MLASVALGVKRFGFHSKRQEVVSRGKCASLVGFEECKSPQMSNAHGLRRLQAVGDHIRAFDVQVASPEEVADEVLGSVLDLCNLSR